MGLQFHTLQHSGGDDDSSLSCQRPSAGQYRGSVSSTRRSPNSHCQAPGIRQWVESFRSTV